MQPQLYDPQTPKTPSTSLADSQMPFLINFSQLFDIFEVNHISLNATSNAGNHTTIQLLEQENALQTDLSEISVYTKDVPGQTDQIFLRYQANGTEFQFTNYQIYAISPTTFFTFLPGKIIVYFGSFTQLPSNVLPLFPAIAKNIMAMSFCPIGLANGLKPKVMPQASQDGFCKGLIVTASVGFNTIAPPCYYIVLGNC
jgi:hypothetical protein